MIRRNAGNFKQNKSFLSFIFMLTENNDAKQRIMDGAERLFFQYGVRSVSMDDVARDLAVSKKTLYQYFENKDELVTDVAAQSIQREMQMYVEVPQQASNAIEELYLISKCIRKTVDHMNPSLMYDLQKYHAQAWAHFSRFKQEFIRGMVTENIRRGKAEGYYRPNINEHILSILRVETVQLVFDQRAFPSSEFDFADVQMQLFDHFLHGLVTEKGRELYNHYTLNEAKQSHS